MNGPLPPKASAVLRMLRAACGTWVTIRYLQAGLLGLDPASSRDALKDALVGIRPGLQAGEELQNSHGYAYRLLSAPQVRR